MARRYAAVPDDTVCYRSVAPVNTCMQSVADTAELHIMPHYSASTKYRASIFSVCRPMSSAAIFTLRFSSPCIYGSAACIAFYELRLYFDIYILSARRSLQYSEIYSASMLIRDVITFSHACRIPLKLIFTDILIFISSHEDELIVQCIAAQILVYHSHDMFILRDEKAAAQ